MIQGQIQGFEPVVLPALRPAGARGQIRMGRLEPGSDVRVEAEVFRKDVRIRVKAAGFSRRRGYRPKPRGVIKGFSHESAKRLKFLIRNTADMWQGFLTLTYPASYPGSGPEVKRDIHTFCTWLGRRKIAYVWILEFQKRGAPHFHFLLSGWIPKEIVKAKWAEIVDSPDPRHKDQGAKIEGVKNPDEVGIYMSKYMGKMDQKEVPLGFEKVGRFWGASRCLTRVTYQFEGLYRDAARELRNFRKFNSSTRTGIASEQKARAAELHQKAMESTSPQERAKLLIHSRTAMRASFSYARRWRWRGYGFVLIRGTGFFRSILRQAVGIDEGKEIWKEVESRPQKIKKYVPLWERGAQLMLDGALDPEWAPDPDFRMDRIRGGDDD